MDAGGYLRPDPEASPPASNGSSGGDPDPESSPTASDGSCSGDNAVAEDGEEPVGFGTPSAKRRLFDADGSASRPNGRRRHIAPDEITQAYTGETTSENTSSTSGTNPVIEALNSFWSKMKEVNARKESKKDEFHQKMLLLEKEKLALEEKKLQFQRDRRDEAIMNMNLTGMTGPQREYYSRLQDEILARLKG